MFQPSVLSIACNPGTAASWIWAYSSSREIPISPLSPRNDYEAWQSWELAARAELKNGLDTLITEKLYSSAASYGESIAAIDHLSLCFLWDFNLRG